MIQIPINTYQVSILLKIKDLKEYLVYLYNIIYCYNIKCVFMSYLVCDQCGGYYELQPGESPDDFKNKCECGGHLKYTQKLDNQKICPNCGKVTENSEICPDCGFKFTKSPVSIPQNNSDNIVSRIGKSILISIFIISPAIFYQAYICFNYPFPTTSFGYFGYFYPTLAMSVVVINYFMQRKKTVF